MVAGATRPDAGAEAVTEPTKRGPLRVALTASQEIEFQRLRRKQGMTRAQLFDAAMEVYCSFHHDKPWPKTAKRRGI